MGRIMFFVRIVCALILVEVLAVARYVWINTLMLPLAIWISFAVIFFGLICLYRCLMDRRSFWLTMCTTLLILCIVSFIGAGVAIVASIDAKFVSPDLMVFFVGSNPTRTECEVVALFYCALWIFLPILGMYILKKKVAGAKE
ncbi:MAG: hypothetical protein A2445_00890 [Candidatus Jacksonbacteria bacterium RIFOXYC2_FULL_44_29]|nr:MAG: hypothetical protein UW45_C0024G0023 [Parcubacteria group bacterium GW2011_GWC2_44_22]OGY79483.1 MAG: hypothetical protein A2445_00890 [Candidatus Jacksonbacteria bacterium RIFOXYC2_FULL_44_29]OGY79979.1 MAG: hypothetical protein A2550_05575 [Candidatus Jacksonbacteria bacterium RIFOXYD2_FULL_43_21]HCC49858.1 hypothetical protein [Candidatus Jacksonbacteria bacterium]HCE48903.1 hypothetical protein [Candidatus Jacksonbacteria bacterium]